MDTRSSTVAAERALQVTYHAPGRCTVGEVVNVCIVVFHRAAEVEDTDALLRAAPAFAERYPGGTSMLVWVAGEAGLPTPEARAGFKQLAHNHRHREGEVAVVLAGTGFWAGAMRGLVAGLRLAMPGRVGVHVYASTSDLAPSFLASHRDKTGIEVADWELKVSLQEAIAHPNPVRVALGSKRF